MSDLERAQEYLEADQRVIKAQADQLQEQADHIAKLEAALEEIEYLDRPQVRGLPRRKTIQQIALEALGRGE